MVTRYRELIEFKRSLMSWLTMYTNYCHFTILVCSIVYGFSSEYVGSRCSTGNPSQVNNNLSVNDTHGSIYSPDYSPITQYPSNTNCKWTITAQTGRIIKLTFKIFDLEPASPISGCTLDYVRVHNGLGSSSSVIGVYCGTLGLFTVKSTGRFLSVLFHSNLFIQRQGFVADYKVEKEPDPPLTTKSVSVALIIAGTIVTVLIIVIVICVAASGKFSCRTRKRARRQMSRSSLGSRVSMCSSRTALAHSARSLRQNGHPLVKTKNNTSPISIPELIVTNAEGKETRLLSKKVQIKAVVHSSPLSKRRYRGLNKGIRRLSSGNVVLPTPPPYRRVVGTGWSDVHQGNRGCQLGDPSSPSFRRHSLGSLRTDAVLT